MNVDYLSKAQVRLGRDLLIFAEWSTDDGARRSAEPQSSLIKFPPWWRPHRSFGRRGKS